jgi:DtxR family transcriptional regulator, Mn-dependent transcriptional regulator
VTKVDLSDAIQDYLKEIYKLETESERVSTSSLARRQQVSPASASAMVKKLAALGLAEHAPYRGVTLTHAGEQVALEVIRHHRLLELYLAETLGIAVDDVHQEADRLEHALSEELEAKIDAELGFPTHDPHGDPIPDSELRLIHGESRSLLDLEPGAHGSIARVPDGDSELLRYLGELGIVPDARVEMLAQAPFGGPVTVRTSSGEHAISRELADRIAAA